MALTQIVLEASRRMMNCDLTWDSKHSWIDLDGVVFIQGDEADHLIDLAQHIYDECGDVSMDDAMRNVMEPYADLSE